MQGRTWVHGLRGVKISLLALSILGASLVSSLVHSRPASAESFLKKTVDCVINALVWKDCSKPATQKTSSPAASPASPGTSGSSSSSPSSAPSPTETTQPTSSNEDVAQAAPLTVDDTVTSPLPDLPTATYRWPTTYDSTTYASFMANTFGKISVSTANDAPVIIRPSEEGWQIFGVAWYWWGTGVAGVVAAVLILRNIRNKANLSLVK